MQELAAIRRNQERLIAIMAPLATRKLTRAQRAKQTGCSIATITRRDKAARIALALERIA